MDTVENHASRAQTQETIQMGNNPTEDMPGFEYEMINHDFPFLISSQR